MNDDTKRVWSSDGGRVRDDTTPRRAAAPAAGGKIRVTRETKGRRGKTVTVVQGLALAAADLADLATTLKKRCGVGGSAKDGVITIQGDKQTEVVAVLKDLGHDVG